MNIRFVGSNLPKLSTDQMREVDWLMVNEYRITLLQMIENAGRNLARLAQARFFPEDIKSKEITVLAGSGGNGGGALVSARHLCTIGAKVNVAIAKQKSEISSTALHQLEILENLGVLCLHADEIQNYPTPDLIIDGVIGYSLYGDPHGCAAELIDWANIQKSPILSLDIPSGLESTTGRMRTPVIHATATLTLALPKKGLFKNNLRNIIGELYLANIGVPATLYKKLNPPLDVENLFVFGDIIRIR